MGWVRRQVDEHVCPKPRLDMVWGVHQGDIWECDECYRQWEVGSGWGGHHYWMPTLNRSKMERPDDLG